jgi:DNA-binding CsgD family transcriptional regulator
MKTLRTKYDNDQPRLSSRFSVLSAREYEVMGLAAQGLSNKAIAHRLKITEGSVKSHLHWVYQKLAVRSRFELIALIK